MMTKHLICFCHLRWMFVYQRPQHLLTRFSTIMKVIVWEEPIFDADHNYSEVRKDPEFNVWIATPHLMHGLTDEEVSRAQKYLLDELMQNMEVRDCISWYYTPMALKFSKHLQPQLTVYDCMDELSAFRFAPPELISLEKALLEKADLVFTGGFSLYEAKKEKHHSIHPFPSSIDKEHFATARTAKEEVADQANIPRPRLGYYGVIDERLDLELVEEVARLRPDWHFIFVGPVVKIDPQSLPRDSNIHYLGAKQYPELPRYLAGWDIAIMPFALNESTKFISPTKTPEYLAGGKPVISTAITDVVNPYGKHGMVEIVHTAQEFVRAAENIFTDEHSEEWLSRVDFYLAKISWDKTWNDMVSLIQEKLKKNKFIHPKKRSAHV